jgi:hypothetical protein
MGRSRFACSQIQLCHSNCCSLSALMSAGQQGHRVLALPKREVGRGLRVPVPLDRTAAAAAAAPVLTTPPKSPDAPSSPAVQLGDAALEAAAGPGGMALQVASEDRPASGELHASCSACGIMLVSLHTASTFLAMPAWLPAAASSSGNDNGRKGESTSCAGACINLCLQVRSHDSSPSFDSLAATVMSEAVSFSIMEGSTKFVLANLGGILLQAQCPCLRWS